VGACVRARGGDGPTGRQPTLSYVTEPSALLPRIRSRNHLWWWRLATIGGATLIGLGVPGGVLLAATEPSGAGGVWKVLLIVCVVLAALACGAAIIGGVCAFITRPVDDEHGSRLKASAEALGGSLDRLELDYGAGYRAAAAFGAHFAKLGANLREWDRLRIEAGNAQAALGQHIEAAIDGRDIVADLDLPLITGRLRGVALARAAGEVEELPSIEWGRATTAVDPGQETIPGPPYGVLNVGPGGDWVGLPPLDGETRTAWSARADHVIDQLESTFLALFDSALPYAERATETTARVNAYKGDELPVVRDALELVQNREAPRRRHRCPQC
jgi:hypothetical protein